MNRPAHPTDVRRVIDIDAEAAAFLDRMVAEVKAGRYVLKSVSVGERRDGIAELQFVVLRRQASRANSNVWEW